MFRGGIPFLGIACYLRPLVRPPPMSVSTFRPPRISIYQISPLRCSKERRRAICCHPIQSREALAAARFSSRCPAMAIPDGILHGSRSRSTGILGSMQSLDAGIAVILKFHNHSTIKDSVAQWIRRWSTEPEILGSIPSGVAFSFYFLSFLFFTEGSFPTF